MKLVWRLLRHHLSVAQLAGFFIANLFGMLIVLLGYQFYCDVLPCFTAEDSFMKSDYFIISREIGASTAVSGRSATFDAAAIDDFRDQPFVRSVGTFVPNAYAVDAVMGIGGSEILRSEIFLESVPDEFVDVNRKDWVYHEGDGVVPVLLPRSYITMYNFGFAKSHALPKISDGLVGMIDFRLSIRGNGSAHAYRGRVIGFTGRLNSILVPRSFMDYTNSLYAPDKAEAPSRLLVKVNNPADERLARYLDDNGYEMERDRMDAEKTAYFLKLLVTIVVGVGIVISVLSFYLLMLSIYLLVQKNAAKLENLFLIGYSPRQVALPYQALAACLHLLVLVLACVTLVVVRPYYMEIIDTLYPAQQGGGVWPGIWMGIGLWLLACVSNIFIIHRRMMCIWQHQA